MIIASEAKNFPFIVKMFSNEKNMKKQHKMFSIHEIMQILADSAHVGTWVDLVAMLGLLVWTLNMTVSKWSENEKVTRNVGYRFVQNENL
jgi:CO dehydrogenase/acetyl-CoA synthase epsilon subunit